MSTLTGNLSIKVPTIEYLNNASCRRGYFQCKTDLYCISKRFVCDEIYDCFDKSDEEGCKNLEHEKYECDNSTKKIPYFLICDGIYDCVDGSDEKTCG